MSCARFENIGWTVGSHCNARCGHCYSRPTRSGDPGGLDATQLEHIVQRLVAMGARSVNLGGNEPAFTHGPRLEDSQLPWLLARTHQAGLTTGLTTNGTSFHFLADHHPDALATLNDVDFSLDFPTQARHDRHRGIPLFAGVIHGIQRCRELGIPCAIATTATAASFEPDTLAAFLELSRLLGCELRVNTLQPVEPSLLGSMPSPEAWYRGFALLLSQTDCVTLGDACMAAFTGQDAQGCPCGHSSFRIHGPTRDGTVPISPCVYAHAFRGGDLLQQSPESITTAEPFASFAARRRRLPRACRDVDCPWLERCRGGCASRAWLVHGSLEARDPYCPLTYRQLHGALPPLPERVTMARGSGTRVHEGYLCTWIGRPREARELPLRGLSDFFDA